ncbi:Tetratricopeptide repeat-containing protein [Bacillus wiedmannii]|uniref:Tetratricopeptide repeat-containing protein n=1 Tax=Bacillus wiedmannii TaxID=1890302 RepID=A0A1G6LU46_9BACI|nr:hypothetical protein [Bacillus wiedmannii]KMP29298.1 hypothetical protein TU50_08930 [Bacillus wiedmannii]SDC46614.1 Tetratricopeptide repeat-containing protein [Bacillus wiedmannii]
MEEQLRRISHLLKLGDVELAKEEAEWMIKEDPEDATGYICLSHVYYFGFRQIDEASKYLEEALKIDHLDENVLLTALDIFYAQENFERLKEIAEIGIKNYPEEGVYYFYVGEAKIHTESLNKGITYYNKAIELEPENDMYVGRYAFILLSYYPKRIEEGIKAEKRALELNPENVTNLVSFANVAREKGNFKKARMLAETAIRLEPNHEGAYKIYRDTIGTKNKYCAFMASFTYTFWNAFSKFCKIFSFASKRNLKLHYILVILSLLGWIILPVYLTGWYAGSVYIVIFMMYSISSIIKGRIHKEVGLGTPFDAEYNVKRNKIIRNREISNMESTVKKEEATTIPTAKLSKEELEAQLEGFWSKGTVYEGQQEVAAAVKEPALSSAEHKKIQSYSDIESPKYNKWYICLIIVLSISFIFKIGKLYNLNNTNATHTTPKISQETKDIIVEQQDKALKDTKESFDKLEVVTVLYVLRKGDWNGSTIEGAIEKSYVPVMLEKVGQPAGEKLKKATPMKIYKEDTRTYALLQNGDSSFIIEITSRKLTHIYGESWNNAQEEMQKYEELLGKIESQGVEAGGI